VTHEKPGEAYEQAEEEILMTIQHLMRHSSPLLVGDADENEILSQQTGKIKEC
jgi:hypothetical protein